MKELKRTRVGNFNLEDAGKMIDLENILSYMNNDQKIELKSEELKKFLNGVKIKIENKDGLINVYSNNKFIGIGEIEKENLKRKIVISNT